MKKAVSIVLVQENRLYIGQRLKESDNYLKLGFPGGKVSEEDNDAECAARRELEEETGIQQANLLPLGEMQFENPDFGLYVSYGFVAIIPPDIKPANCEPHKNRAWYRTSTRALMNLDPTKLLPGTREFAHAAEQTLTTIAS